MSRVRIDHAVSSGTFSLDGETFDVDNNIWVIGDDDECVVIDAPHDVDDILAVVAGRKVKAIICTHAHDDHVRVAPELRERVSAPILLHPADKEVWELTHTDYLWDVDLEDGQTVKVGGAALKVLHTPGSRAGCGLPLRARPRLRLHRRHPLRGRARCDRALVQRRGRDQAVDPASPVRPARRDRGAHRARCRHHDRRRAREPGVRPQLARSVFAGLLGISLVMFLLPGDDVSASAPNDKLVHGLTFVALAVAGRWAGVRPVRLGLGLAAYAAVTEILQAVLPIDRHGDVRDFRRRDGIVLGLLLSSAVGWRSAPASRGCATVTRGASRGRSPRSRRRRPLRRSRG